MEPTNSIHSAAGPAGLRDCFSARQHSGSAYKQLERRTDMSWRDIMRRVLPPIGDLSPEITSAYGTTKGRKPPASIPHGGVDFNYPIGQTGINLKHPALRSPVAGIVTTNPGEGTFGRIAIRDANGFSHEILHTQTQYVKRGDL